MKYFNSNQNLVSIVSFQWEIKIGYSLCGECVSEVKLVKYLNGNQINKKEYINIYHLSKLALAISSHTHLMKKANNL